MLRKLLWPLVLPVFRYEGPAAVGGTALWATTALLGGRAEPWDSGFYWTISYPLALIGAMVLGYAFPGRPWRWAVTASSIWCMAASCRIPESRPGGPRFAGRTTWPQQRSSRGSSRAVASALPARGSSIATRIGGNECGLER